MRKADELGIGVMVRFGAAPAQSFKTLREQGLRHCQLAAPPDSYLFGDEGRKNTGLLMNAIEEYDISVTSLFISFPDQDWSDIKNGIGLVPPASRAKRIARACRSADWARELGIEQIASHVGWVPDSPEDPVYRSFIEAMRYFCMFLEANGQVLAYETGMESAAVLDRMMQDIGVANQRINFDPANLLIYNYDDPMRFLEKMGDKVVHVHCKDAVRPALGELTGKEVRLGEGQTGFPALFRKLYGMGYRGPLTIEREIPAGKEQDDDIAEARKLIEALKNEMRRS